LLSVGVINKHIDSYRFRFSILGKSVLDKVLFDIEKIADFNNTKIGQENIKSNIIKRKNEYAQKV